MERLEGISDADLALGCIHSTVLAAIFVSSPSGLPDQRRRD